MNPSEILIIKLRAIGDVVLSTAVLPNLKAAYPDAEIHFLTESASAPLIEDNPGVDRMLVLPARNTFQSNWSYNRAMFRFLRQIRQQHYEWVFDLFGNPRSALMTWLSGAPVRVGYRFRGRVLAYNKRVEPRGDRVHEIEFNLDALRALDIPIRSSSPELFFAPESTTPVRAWIDQTFSSGDFLVALHPWGSWKAKRWPLPCFAELADRLVRNLGAEVIVLWGPGEKPVAEEVRRLSRENLTLAPQTTLKELGALLACCRLVVANDSGPMHIAAALGVPTIGLFGPTHPKRQGPCGRNGLAIWRKDLSCIGCNRLVCPEGTCLTGLAVDQVETEIMHFLRVRDALPSGPKRTYQKTKAS